MQIVIDLPISMIAGFVPSFCREDTFPNDVYLIEMIPNEVDNSFSHRLRESYSSGNLAVTNDRLRSDR